jgi:iron complex outermembrane receptor protein
MIKPLTAAISSILLFSAIPAGAHAQDATPAGATATTQDAARQDARKKDKAVELGQVIVTGTRTPKAVDEIPGAITVI